METKFALGVLNIEPKKYIKDLKFINKDPTTRITLDNDDWALRFRLDPIELNLSKEQYKKIALEDKKARL